MWVFRLEKAGRGGSRGQSTVDAGEGGTDLRTEKGKGLSSKGGSNSA